MNPYAPGNDRREMTSKYRRPRRYLSRVGLVLGFILGIGGALFYTWVLAPVEEFDTEPWQLSEADKAHYLVAITLSYAYDGDLNRTVTRLHALSSTGDFIQLVADTACELATTGYVDSSSGLHAVQSMMQFYQLQGRSGCADALIPSWQETGGTVVIEAPTPTIPPPATKTPTPGSPDHPTPSVPAPTLPTAPPQSEFVLVDVRTFCHLELSGLIEVYVQESGGGQGIPGQPVRIRWDGGEDIFYTGLKPERGPGYADFQMEPGKGYTIDMPGRSDPITDPLVATPCTVENGQQAITSYRAFFRPAG